MKITKFGHCCLLLEHEGKKLLTDPGNYTEASTGLLRDIDAILVTHEHTDHLHMDSVKLLAQNNPGAELVGNASVAALLQKEGLLCTTVGDGASAQVRGVLVEGFGREHEPIYQEFGLVENTGYLVAQQFYFPGDAFHSPGKTVDILALPIAGPWMKFSQAMEFAKVVKPRVCFGVHDGMIKPSSNFGARMAPDFLGREHLEFVHLQDGDSREF